MLNLEKLLRGLMAQMETLKVEVFTHPPKTMEEFELRRGKFLAVKEMFDNLVNDAKGIEKD